MSPPIDPVCGVSKPPPPRQRHLFASWPKIADRLRTAKHLALFLDFDGTLAPLCRRPEEVSVEEATRRLVRRLARCPRLSVAVISGRRLADLRRRVRVRGVRYLGLHGWENNGRRSLDRAQHQALLRAKRLLASRLTGLADVWIEDKGFTLAVHHPPSANSAASRVPAILRRTLEPFTGQLRVLRGHQIWEVLPRDIGGKGKAALAMLEKLPAGALPIYVGDDRTDESAFAALAGGLTIRVGGTGPTRARHGLRDPGEVQLFLRKLEAEIA